jgi:coenzyme F420-reducing hydrogenase delta subunit
VKVAKSYKDWSCIVENKPVIVAFCCHYCAYAAADLAGTMRLQYPDSVRILRLPCTGKIEVNYLLAAFERGVDGVIVAGCLEGGCHYQEGNLRARRRVERAKQMLKEIGLEPERVEMFNLSSAEGTRFAAIVAEMNERIAQLGPSPLRRSDAVSSGVTAPKSPPTPLYERGEL